MKIVTTYHGTGAPGARWSAIDDASYDGAGDAVFPFNAMGRGDTEVEAIQDLMAQFEADDKATQVQHVAPSRKELPENPEQTASEWCPSCKRNFPDGGTCPRGGCPMGGDI